MEKTKKLYVVANYGEYADHVDTKNKRCGWSHGSPMCHSLSLTYRRAYNLMRRINRLYDFNRCYVQPLNKADYQPYWWGRFVEVAHDNEIYG